MASTGLTLTATSFDHRQVVIEIDAQSMPDGKGWVTFEIDSTATAMNVGRGRLRRGPLHGSSVAVSSLGGTTAA